MRFRRDAGGLSTQAYSDAEPFDIRRRGGRREWSPHRSKLAAYVMKTGDESVIPSRGSALYLGAGNGYTVSFVSDCLGNDGAVYCVEFSEVCARDLLALASSRSNVHPIIEDARLPERYAPVLPMADWLMQDISQPDQARIFARHLGLVKSGGVVLLSLKLECLRAGIGRDEATAEVMDAVGGMARFDRVADLSPYERGHLLFAGRRM